MTTYRCMACGMGLEVEVTKEFDIVEVKPCEACLSVAEEESHDKGYEEGYEACESTVEEDVGP